MLSFVRTLCVVLLPLLCACGTKNAQRKVQRPISFDAAKAAAGKHIYYDHRITFYCGCKYNKAGVIDPTSCGYSARRSAVRGARLEWEHIVPAAAFGTHRICWKACPGLNGRLCCRKTDPEFRRMEADLMNLVPAVGELNGDRSNRPYGIVDGEPRVYGSCDFEIDFKKDIVEPAESIRGFIGRTYLYMVKTYKKGLPLSAEQLNMFQDWAATHPPTDWEKEREERILKIQGQ